MNSEERQIWCAVICTVGLVLTLTFLGIYLGWWVPHW